jgi:SAM-dependent methyltransferase
MPEDRHIWGLAHQLLKAPWLFKLQQRLCNDYRAVRAEFEEHLSADGLRILDIGCSTGLSATVLFDMERQSYTGVELSPDYAAIAQAQNPRGRVMAMDARKLDLPDAAFDVAVFLGVWHHMDDQTVREALAEVRRVLKPGGKLLVAEPLFTPGRLLSNLLLRHDRGKHIRDEAGYRALAAGWRLERERTFMFSLHRMHSMVLSWPA